MHGPVEFLRIFESCKYPLGRSLIYCRGNQIRDEQALNRKSLLTIPFNIFLQFTYFNAFRNANEDFGNVGQIQSNHLFMSLFRYILHGNHKCQIIKSPMSSLLTNWRKWRKVITSCPLWRHTVICLYEFNEGLPRMVNLHWLNIKVPSYAKLLHVVESSQAQCLNN